jgi:3-hydroxyisobutyrate dehydrogenase-like beta-hydroxyacid dehydrogenase
MPALGFIGFGEAGTTVSRGLHLAGAGPIFAYDITPKTSDVVTIVGSPRELAASADVIFSAVTSSSALEAARQNAPFLTSRHLYADINSVSPALKQVIDRVITATGASFVEVAVMAPVSPYGHTVPMLLGGAGAKTFVETMSPFGMKLEILEGAKVGSAAAVKMCRSIVVKGIEALLFECVMAATTFGADDLVFASLRET